MDDVEGPALDLKTKRGSLESTCLLAFLAVLGIYSSCLELLSSEPTDKCKAGQRSIGC